MVTFFESNGQDTTISYMNSFWKTTTVENASYIRKVFKNDQQKWAVNDYYKCGIIQMQGTFKSKKAKKKQGEFKYYFKDGTLDSEGYYINDKKDGEWTWYFKNGQVSAREIYDNGKVTDIDFWHEDGTPKGKSAQAIEYPEYVGGIEEMYNFLRENLEYPQWAVINNLKGSIMVSFIIEEDGSINDVKASKPIHPTLDKAAIDVVKKMPNWVPGKYHNRYRRTAMSLPINFKLR